MITDEIIYGATPCVRDVAGITNQWKLVRDPVELAMADEIVPGSSVEEIVDTLNAELGGGLLQFVNAPWGASGNISRNSPPLLAPGADIFEAARMAQGLDVQLPRDMAKVEPPEGAVWFDGTAQYDWHRCVWVHDGFVYKAQMSFDGSVNSHWIAYEPTSEGRTCEDAIQEIKGLHAYVKRQKKKDVSESLLTSGARTLYVTARNLLGSVLADRIGSEITPHPKRKKRVNTRRGCLEAVLDILDLAKQVQGTTPLSRRSDRHYVEMRQLLQRSKDNWERVQHKKDAELVREVIDRLFPEEQP